MICEIFESDSSLVVRMDASQAFDPGSSPGYRISFLFLIINNNILYLKYIVSILKKTSKYKFYKKKTNYDQLLNHDKIFFNLLYFYCQ